MGYRCCAYNCKEEQNEGCAYAFYAFPKDPLLKKKWIHLMRRKNFIPSDETRICAKHFELDAFHKDEVRNSSLLKADAIPTLFDFTNKRVRPKRKHSEAYETSNKRLFIESSGEIAAGRKKKCVSPIPSLKGVNSSSVSGRSSCEVISTDVKTECASPVSSQIAVDSSFMSESSSHENASVSMKAPTDSSMNIAESQPLSVPKSSPFSTSTPELKKPENFNLQVSSTSSTDQTSSYSEKNNDFETNRETSSMNPIILRKMRVRPEDNITNIDLSEVWEKLYHLAKRLVVKQRKKIRRLTTYKRSLEAKVKRLATLVDVLIQREICDR